ncbi:MAG: MmcQ/YjbR family DNA-binding protein [Pseudomonadota bacterium]
MTRDEADTICAALPGAAYLSHAEGGLDAWKVGGKMFACFGHSDDGISVKTDSVDTATFLIDIGAAQRAKYFHRSWVRVTFADTDIDEVRDRIHTSYGLIRASLTKKAQAALAPWPTPD